MNVRSSAILDVSSTSQGILFPRLSLPQILALTAPANGLLVFCTTDYNFYVSVADSINWKSLSFGIVHKYCYGITEDTCSIYGGVYIWDEARDWICLVSLPCMEVAYISRPTTML